MEQTHSADVKTSGNDGSHDVGESSLQMSASEIDQLAQDDNDVSGFDVPMPDDILRAERERSLGIDGSMPIKPESEAGSSQQICPENAGLDLVASLDDPPVGSDRPVNLGESILGRPRPLTVNDPCNIASADASSTNGVSPVESARDTAGAEFNAPEDAGPTERAPANLGESAPKADFDLGHSSLRTPAKLDATARAKAAQARYARQFNEKIAAELLTVYPGTSSPCHTVESANRAGSDVLTPSESGEAAGDICPEQAEFEVLKTAYQLRKNAHINDLESDIAFLRAEAKEMARLRKAQADGQYHHDSSTDADTEAGLFMTPRNRKRKAEKASDMPPPSRKRARKTKATTGRSLGASKNGSKGLSSEEIERTVEAIAGSHRPTAAKKTKESSHKHHNISNFTSLLGRTDVFRDAEEVADRSNQPAFKAGTSRRDYALKDLIASVPQDDKPAAIGDKKFLEQSLKDFDGQGSCKPSKDGSGWSLSGMNCTLKHYQVLGVAFMRKRENQENHPRGGILADEMGLGKTIQMIANIINGKPKPGQPRTTLIVASPALISQWHAEILKFTQTRKENRKHGIERVVQHRYGYKQGGDDEAIRKAIMESDICLTTYTEVMKSYPKAIFPVELTTDRQKSEWWREYFQENKGVFHDMKFLRVVLDEAQAIKNHTTHSSMACRALKSEYYWAISGTPLVNGISEMYPYLKFLRHPHTGSIRTFQANFCSPNDPTGSEKLGVFLRQIIIRRTHKDLMFGARLLDLPTPKQNVIYLEFNAVERTIYEIVKHRFIQRINTITRRDGINAQYSHIWTMLLRLRQICSHVLLIQGTILDLLEREDFEKLDGITRETGHSKEQKEVLEHLSLMLAAHIASSANQAPDASARDVDAVPGGFNNIERTAPNLGKKHGKTYDFHKYLDSAAQTGAMDAINARTKCCSCRRKPVNPQVTSCHHIYCKSCLRSLQHAAARTDDSGGRCIECGDRFQSVRDLRDLSDLQTGTEKRESKVDELDWIGQPGQILPDAKTVAAKAQILTWLAEAPACKIIVYTQFLPMIRIMGKVCRTEGWGFLNYAGNMSQGAREKALKDFADDKEKRVMLMSLKCGGLGLNIVAASRVILMDPWWNDAVEQQAFCRVFRIGQTDETRLTRLCIKNSIDSAMFAVKERKTAEIDKVMDQPDKGPRSTADLLRLFGPVGEDEDGRPGFIFPEPNENDEEDETERFYEIQERNAFFRPQQKNGFSGNDL